MTNDPRSLTLTTLDGFRLESEYLPVPSGHTRAAIAICHPHPQHGGTMQSLVVSELVRALPGQGIACLRFNFRGVGASEGSWDAGVGERLDAESAVEALSSEVDPAVPLILAGWSFGADVALSVQHPRHAGWLAIAAPLRWAQDLDRTGADPRPKYVVLAEHDEVRPPREIQEETARWAATTSIIVPGASHFFVGRTDRLVTIAAEMAESLIG